MREAQHNKSLSDGLKIFGLSAIEIYFIVLCYYPARYFLGPWMSTLGVLTGYLICRAADSVEPHLIETFVRYMLLPKVVRKR